MDETTHDALLRLKISQAESGDYDAAEELLSEATEILERGELLPESLYLWCLPLVVIAKERNYLAKMEVRRRKKEARREMGLTRPKHRPGLRERNEHIAFDIALEMVRAKAPSRRSTNQGRNLQKVAVLNAVQKHGVISYEAAKKIYLRRNKRVIERLVKAQLAFDRLEALWRKQGQ